MGLLDRIKKILGVSNQDELILEIVTITEEKILSYLNITELPLELNWILIELSIQRFNRIGSEGVSSESVDGGTNTYIVDELEPYYKYLDEYANTNKTKKGYKLF